MKIDKHVFIFALNQEKMKFPQIFIPVVIIAVVVIVVVVFFFRTVDPTSTSRSFKMSATTHSNNHLVRELDSLDIAESDISQMKTQIQQKASGYQFMNQGISTSIFRIVKWYNEEGREGKAKNF